MLFPLGLLPFIELRFTKISPEGLVVPNVDGTITCSIAGLNTAQATYTDALGAVANPVIINIGADGRPDGGVPVFLAPTGYKFVVKDSDGAILYSIDDVENVGSVFASIIGTAQTAGSKSVSSGYTVVATDRLVTVASTGGANPCLVNLPPAAQFSARLIIKNMGTIPLAVTPVGSETIDSVNAAYTIAASSTPTFHSRVFISDNISAWWVETVA